MKQSTIDSCLSVTDSPATKLAVAGQKKKQVSYEIMNGWRWSKDFGNITNRICLLTMTSN